MPFSFAIIPVRLCSNSWIIIPQASLHDGKRRLINVCNLWFGGCILPLFFPAETLDVKRVVRKTYSVITRVSMM